MRMCLYENAGQKDDYFFPDKFVSDCRRGIPAIKSDDSELPGIIQKILQKNCDDMNHFKQIKQMWIENRRQIPVGKSFKDFLDDSFNTPAIIPLVKNILEVYGLVSSNPEKYMLENRCLNFYLRVFLSRFYYHYYLGNSRINRDIFVDIQHHIYGLYSDLFVTNDAIMLEIYNQHILPSYPSYKIPKMRSFEEFKKHL